MVTLLYHARANGYICKRIAAASEGAIVAKCDKEPLAPVDGTLVRWDSKAPLLAGKTINSAEAVKLSRNKRESRMALVGLCPPTWIMTALVQFPCVVRPRRHFGGKNFYVCKTREEMLRAVRRCGPKHWYASKLIDKDKEYRVFVLNGAAFKVIRRYRDDADPSLPWNFHSGGKSIRVMKEHWPAKVVENAVAASAKIGLQLAAVDVIVDKEGTPFVLELNTAPGLDRDKTIQLFAKKLAVL